MLCIYVYTKTEHYNSNTSFNKLNLVFSEGFGRGSQKMNITPAA